VYEKYEYANSSTRRLPPFLKRSLRSSEVERKFVNLDSKKYAVVKHGRTSKWTLGYLQDIKSDYHSQSSPIITDELPVISPAGSPVFSKGGDSGSLVFDVDGFIVGMLWGGQDETGISYITPIEVILEDIKEACGAKNVELLVRDEDKAEVYNECQTEHKPFAEPEGPMVWDAFHKDEA